MQGPHPRVDLLCVPNKHPAWSTTFFLTLISITTFLLHTSVLRSIFGGLSIGSSSGQVLKAGIDSVIGPYGWSLSLQRAINAARMRVTSTKLTMLLQHGAVLSGTLTASPLPLLRSCSNAAAHKQESTCPCSRRAGQLYS